MSSCANSASAFARAHVRRVPIRPFVRRRDDLERPMVDGGLAKQVREGGDVAWSVSAREALGDLSEQPTIAVGVGERP